MLAQIPASVVVTGIGMVLPGCDDRERFWEQLRSGASAVKLCPDPAGSPAQVRIGRVDDFDPRRYLDGLVEERFYQRHSRAVQLYLCAFVQARYDAALALVRCDRERVGVYQGSSRDSFAYWHAKFQIGAVCRQSAAETYTRRELLAGMPAIGPGIAASVFGIEGPTCGYSASCCSGAVAIGHAFREIAAGEVDVAFAGGHDAALCAPLFAMYRDAGLFSSDDPESAGALAEGAVVLVLESRAHAERRGARILATIGGFSHRNEGDRAGRAGDEPGGTARLIRSLLSRSGLAPEELAAVVGDRTVPLPLLSTRATWGNTLGASSALDVAAAVSMVHSGEVRAPDAAIACLSRGVGGHHAAILVQR